MPTISIGMPVYNGERYLNAALDSLLAQTFTDFEIFISDNGSTDATKTICEEYLKKDRRIKYVRQNQNLGATKNFQVVMTQATGAFFMWASCDDVWSADWLGQLHDKLEGSDAGMVFGNITCIDASGKPLEHPANGTHFRYAEGPLWRRVRFYLAHEGLGKANALFALYKIEMRDHLSDVWSKLNRGECMYDYTVVYECLKYQKLEFAERATMFIRVHSDSEGTMERGGENFADRTFRRIKSVVWPIPQGLLTDYLRNSSNTEKLILSLLVPIKLASAYMFVSSKLYSKYLRANRG